MILLDCGNSSLKAQRWDSARVQASFASSYDADWQRRLAHWLDRNPATECYQSSVLDYERQSRLDDCLSKFGANLIRFESAADGGGVINAYRQPERLGIDRWLALVGAAGLVDGDCMVIDAGSAITLDLLLADGRHLGGAILPGLCTSAERFRQIFSHIDFNDPQIAANSEPGCSTEAAIQIDYPLDSIGRLRELVTSWMQLLDHDASILLAGGDAPGVQESLGRPARIVPDLVFLGMSRLVAG